MSVKTGRLIRSLQLNIVSNASGWGEGGSSKSLRALHRLLSLAGPALFRGRLKAFGKGTDGGASSKGRQNLDSVRLTV